MSKEQVKQLTDYMANFIAILERNYQMTLLKTRRAS